MAVRGAAEAPTLDLRDNYRSTPQIVDAAMAVLPLRVPLQPLQPKGPPVQVNRFVSQPISHHNPSIIAGIAPRALLGAANVHEAMRM